MKLITVFTPTYNRKALLERTYKSLVAQTSKNFVWLIVDDGSSDGTEEVVNLWKQQENGFEILYFYKQNGGMHTAHNFAYKNIKTELNVCIDSDDMMPSNAIELIEKFWLENGDDSVAGIVALDSDFEGNVLGGKINCNVKKATTLELYNKYKKLLPLKVRLKALGNIKFCVEDEEIILFVLGNVKYIFNKLSVKEKGYFDEPRKIF